jgi:molecular chaperone GrpE
MSEIESGQPEVAAENGESPTTPSAEDRLADAEGRAAEHRADFLRAIAELENVRKRSAREVDAARQFGIEKFAANLLPVADTLDLALQSGAGADAAAMSKGQEATQRLLLKAFEQAGLAPIDPAGQPFDPGVHEAMAMQPAAQVPPHTVLQVVQKGWLLNGRLLRPARVIVSTVPEAPPDSSPGG